MMAKLHVRYMVGGSTPGVEDELVFRFQFPERPGALLKFLNGLSGSWNISLFHYRNHGADYVRVLAGIQVPAAERAQLRRSLDELGYPYWDESDNPAYRSFLNRNALDVTTSLRGFDCGRLPVSHSADWHRRNALFDL